MVSILVSGPSCPGFKSQYSRNDLRGKKIYVGEFNPCHGLEESGLWLQNVDHTLLVLAVASQCYKKVRYLLRFWLVTNSGWKSS